MTVRILLLAATAAAGVLSVVLLRREAQPTVRTLLRAVAAFTMFVVGLDVVSLRGGDPLGSLRSAVLSFAGTVLP
ncbi:hypothetical protein ACF07T_39890 [Streptomyces sp. NPDC015184]|uniref:hypothetical protein n=1 Tax=Streptomyces sp. NPDC015184 TaxID=3364946 RepID=UPI0036F6971C